MLISVILCGCGISSEKIANSTIKQQQLFKLYDLVAPTVALLDEASVELYDEIGKIVRKSIRAVSSDFEDNLSDAMKGADVFIDVSVPNIVSAEMASTMVG